MKNKNTLKEIQVSYQQGDALATKVSCSNDAERIARKVYNITNSNIELKEYFFLLLLNRANNVIGFYKLSEGGISATVADIRIAFAIALKSLACGMILVHNHPSGNTLPSHADRALTTKYKKAGELLDIEVMDHLILTKDSNYSFIENGF